jgi:hypothetical protein
MLVANLNNRFITAYNKYLNWYITVSNPTFVLTQPQLIVDNKAAGKVRDLVDQGLLTDLIWYWDTTFIQHVVSGKSGGTYCLVKNQDFTLFHYQGADSLRPLASSNVSQGIYFDGVDDTYYLYSSGAIESSLTSFTISFWVQAGKAITLVSEATSGVTGTSGQSYLFDPPYGTDPNAGVGVSVGWNGIQVFEHAGAYAPCLAKFDGTVGLDWNHGAIVCDNKQYKIYLNGELVRTGLTTNKTAIRLIYSLAVNFNAWNSFYKGSVNEVGMFSKALSTSEVANLYRVGLVKSAYSPKILRTSLVFWLDFASAIGSVNGTGCRDLSGNERNGTLNGNTVYSSANSGVMVFDGNSDYIQISGTLSSIRGTYIAWIKRNGSQSNYCGIFFSRDTNVSGLIIVDNKLYYTWNNNFWNWDSGLTIPDNEWCMVSISITSTAATLYIHKASGVSSVTNTATHGTATMSDIKLGVDDFSLTGRAFKGSIGKFYIYTNSLNSTELGSIFDNTKQNYLG